MKQFQMCRSAQALRVSFDDGRCVLSRLHEVRLVATIGGMGDRLSGFVSLHPYFKVPPDKLASFEGDPA